MPDRDAAVTRIGKELGFRTDQNANIVIELDTAQRFFESGGGFDELPWFLVTTVTDLSITASEDLALPTDFLREHEQGSLWIYDATQDADARWTEVRKSNYDDMLATYQDTTGKPEAYDLFEFGFKLRPIPDKAYTGKLIYYKKDTVLSAGSTENDWLNFAYDAMCGEAGFNVATPLRDKEAQGYFDALRTRGKVAVTRGTEAREHANQRYVMGGDDY